jgi:hypothetical protein
LICLTVRVSPRCLGSDGHEDRHRSGRGSSNSTGQLPAYQPIGKTLDACSSELREVALIGGIDTAQSVDKRSECEPQAMTRSLRTQMLVSATSCRRSRPLAATGYYALITVPERRRQISGPGRRRACAGPGHPGLAGVQMRPSGWIRLCFHWHCGSWQ